MNKNLILRAFFHAPSCTRASSLFCTAVVAALATLPVTTSFAATPQLTVSPAQNETARQVAHDGVPLSELAPNAPDRHTVKRGDTLWAISKLFLKSPWRWPELWGMNLSQIKNPHLIYPGQTLYLDKSNGRARLSSQAAGNGRAGSELETVKLSPRTRVDKLADPSIPTLQNNLIEPFLSEPIIVDELTLEAAPRFVATQEGRVLLSEGDRAYARSASGTSLTTTPGSPRSFRIFRNATALKDPGTGEVLGYEAQYIGRARLARAESVVPVRGADTKDGATTKTDIVPATVDIVRSKEEIRTGDRLLPEPPLEVLSYTPHAPATPVEARIVSVYGSTVANVAQNQIVVINRGTKDGIERGHVLAIQTNGERLVDKTGPNWQDIKLPDERNGLLMVFRPFEKLSYALILQATEPAKVGDWLINPR
ncbi:MAG: LysM domain-containing protein [Burkholderiaceae bacterium]|nr:LysM domain-containing protein [Burkholderiaceae bacterium]